MEGMDKSAAAARGWRADRGLHVVWPGRHERLGQRTHKNSRHGESGGALHAGKKTAKGGSGISTARRGIFATTDQQQQVSNPHCITLRVPLKRDALSGLEIACSCTAALRPSSVLAYF